jgi:flagellar biosynthesis protein FlhF
VRGAPRRIHAQPGAAAFNRTRMPGRLIPVLLRTYRAFTHEQALGAARGDLGENLRIVQTRSLRRPGLLGFWMRPIIELTVEVPAPAVEPATTRSAPTAAARAYQSSAADENQESPPLDMALERAKTQRLAQALAVKLEKEAELRANVGRNERLVEQTADLQRTITDRATPNRDETGGSNRIEAPSEQVARRFMLVPDQQPGADRNQERQALLDDEVSDTVSIRSASPERDPIERAVGRAVSEERDGLGDFGGSGRRGPEVLRSLYARLIEQEVTRELADQVIAETIEDVGPGGICDMALVRRAAERRIAALLPIDEHPLDAEMVRASEGPYVVAMIGPTGVGKTTTIAKLAAACRFRDGLRVGLLTTDSFRMAAVEQLRSYAEILKVPLEVVIEPTEMAGALERLSDRDVILIDSAGRSRRDEERLEQLQSFLDAAQPDETHLVLSTTSGERTMLRNADAFSSLGADRVVLTKLDETDGFGVILNVIRQLGTRISFVTTGQEVPDDIEQGGAERIARMLLAGIEPRDSDAVVSSSLEIEAL